MHENIQLKCLSVCHYANNEEILFTEEILESKFHILCSVCSLKKKVGINSLSLTHCSPQFVAAYNHSKIENSLFVRSHSEIT